MSHAILDEGVPHHTKGMPLILLVKRLLRLPNRFIYTMLPSKDEVTVRTAHFDHDQDQTADGTPESPRHWLWSRQT
jgi:hypothetical protein